MTFFLEITSFWAQKSGNLKQIQSEDFFFKITIAARKRIQLLNAALKLKSLPTPVLQNACPMVNLF